MSEKEGFEALWKKFYQDAWALRHRALQVVLQSPDCDAFMACERLKRFEGYHVIVPVDTPSGAKEFAFRKKLYTEDLAFTQRPFEDVRAYRDGKTSFPNYPRPVDYLLDIIDQHSFDSIVELGGGYAQNLFALHARGGATHAQFFMGEYTESGCQMAQQLAQFAPKMKLKVSRFDHNAPDISWLPKEGKVLCFTAHSIEQVHELSPFFFEKVSQIGSELLVIQFEPFGFQVPLSVAPASQFDPQHKKFFENVHWNLNFYDQLTKAQDRGILQILAIEKNRLPGDESNPTSVAIWKPKR